MVIKTARGECPAWHVFDVPHGNAVRRRMNDCQPQGGRELGLNRTVNRCEPLLNVVTTDKPKGLPRRKTEGLEPKGKWPGRGALSFPLTDQSATGEQAGPNRFRSAGGTWEARRPPARVGSRKASRGEGG